MDGGRGGKTRGDGVMLEGEPEDRGQRWGYAGDGDRRALGPLGEIRGAD